MLVGIMTTDNGPHPTNKWAYASASMLLESFKINAHSVNASDLEIMKDEIRPKIAFILKNCHDACQKGERDMLATGGHSNRLLMQPDASEHCDTESAVSSIYALVEPLLGSAQLFEGGTISSLPVDIQKYVMGIIKERVETDLRTNIHIERSWHADRYPGNEHAVAFRKMYHG